MLLVNVFRLECDLVARTFRQFIGLAPLPTPIVLLEELAIGIMRIDLDVDVLFRLACKFLVVYEPPPLRPDSKAGAGCPFFMEGILEIELFVCVG